MTKRFNDLIDAYAEMFDEAFPTRMVSDPDETMRIIEECLKTGKPYDPSEEEGFDPEADY